jgi:hypothetical protein
MTTPENIWIEMRNYETRNLVFVYLITTTGPLL